MKSPAYSLKGTGKKMITSLGIVVLGALATWLETEAIVIFIDDFNLQGMEAILVSVNTWLVAAIRNFVKSS